MGVFQYGIDAAKNIAAGQAQADQLNYQGQVATNNAAITRYNASQASVEAGVEESTIKAKGDLLAGAQKTAQAASGIDVGLGSAADVRASSANLSALDAATLHYNAQKAAYASAQTANAFDSEAANDASAAKNAKKLGYLNAASSVISDVTSTAAAAAKAGAA